MTLAKRVHLNWRNHTENNGQQSTALASITNKGLVRAPSPAKLHRLEYHRYFIIKKKKKNCCEANLTKPC